MNFRRGKQLIVYDTGLSEMGGGYQRSQVLTPPVAYRRWVLHPNNTAPYILRRVAMVAAEASGGLDAVHFMGHGRPGHIALGRGGLDNGSLPAFREVRGNVRVIVFFSCQVGGEHHGHGASGWIHGQPPTFARNIVEATGAKVVVAIQNQSYRVGANGEIDFGAWEGPVDVYEPGGIVSTHQAFNPFHRIIRPFDLEQVIFG